MIFPSIQIKPSSLQFGLLLVVLAINRHKKIYYFLCLCSSLFVRVDELPIFFVCRLFIYTSFNFYLHDIFSKAQIIFAPVMLTFSACRREQEM